jgi:NAD/NADP transhydrogenase beta subunit
MIRVHDINPEFDDADAAIIVGANDVVNPSAGDPEVESLRQCSPYGRTAPSSVE